MTMNDMHLNLARKWRSKTFDELVGQDVSVKMLKNSLYLGNLFPVYLLWGQRGTGKTSLARIFAAALNCAALDQFRKNPRSQLLPCLECTSCLAMQSGKHPDFIELDAASNTGVDHVRTIIESASLMPVMGSKKIYLIDEAHMLSKAAFNALLKMLEEPPAAALFMLATTDPYKIIDTVRSRCFQLPLRALEAPLLTDHLVAVCDKEAISADRQALELIAHESEGSARDALNLLEQVRYASGAVDCASVRLVLGRVDDAFLLTILHALIMRDNAVLMHCLNEPLYRQSDAEYVWQRMVEFIRMLIWAHHSIAVKAPSLCVDRINDYVHRVPLNTLLDMLQLFYDHEPVFSKTANKHLLLELLLLKMCKNKGGQSGGAANLLGAQAVSTVSTAEDDDAPEEDGEESEDEENQTDESAPVEQNGDLGKWQVFVQKIDACHDMLLSSIIKQACFKNYNGETRQICIAFGAQFGFFKEWLEQTRNVWQPLLEASFGAGVACVVQFDQSLVLATQENIAASRDQAKTQDDLKLIKPATKNTPAHVKKVAMAPLPTDRVSPVDARLYPRAQMILHYFPGVLKEG